MAKAQLSKRERGIRAGLLTFFLSPPLGGAALGIIVSIYMLITAVTRVSPASPLHVPIPIIILLAPISSALLAFLVAGLPAAVAAIYVSIRVGRTGRIGWAETVILSIVCLAFIPVLPTPGVPYYDFLLSHGIAMLILAPWSLFAALTLRYLAGRWGLVP